MSSEKKIFKVSELYETYNQTFECGSYERLSDAVKSAIEKNSFVHVSPTIAVMYKSEIIARIPYSLVNPNSFWAECLIKLAEVKVEEVDATIAKQVSQFDDFHKNMIRALSEHELATTNG